MTPPRNPLTEITPHTTREWRWCFRFCVVWLVVCGGGFSSCSSSPAVEVQLKARQGDIPFLLDRLTHRDEWIVADAARGLGHHRATVAIPGLILVLEDETMGPYARLEAGLALAAMGTWEAAAPLRLAFQRAGHPEERYWLLVALSAFCNEETLGLLEQAQSESDIFLARAAFKGLEQCREHRETGGEP